MVVATVGCSQTDAKTPPAKTRAALSGSVAKPAEIEVLSRRKALRYDPCSDCHQHVTEGGPVMSPHATIRVQHMEGGENCTVCHKKETPDFLQLVSGRVVSIDAAHELCEQCHSPQVKDWRLGIHGKQVGNWRKRIQRFSCSHCHDPHKPAYGSQIALPPAPFPPLGIRKTDH